GAAGTLALGAALYFGARWRADVQAPTPWQVLETITQASFANHVGTRFSVEVTPQEEVELQLLQLKDLKIAASQAGESFSLLWAGTSQQPLAQVTYLFHHAQLGPFPLFIVPAPPSHSAVAQHRYLATFNRLVF